MLPRLLAPLLRALALSVLLPWAALPIAAQTTPAPAAAVDEEDEEAADVVILEEFNVQAQERNDYLASESLTGTRIVAEIKDLPFAVNVVTSEFLEDFGLYELQEQFDYVSSVSPNETQTSSQIRGFETDQQLRNGFRRSGLVDKVNVDRAEVIKGPAASIYGQINPGGTINIITKKPKERPQQSFSAAYGSLEFFRAQVSSTGPVGSSDKLFYRVDAAVSTRAYEQDFRSTDVQTVAAQLAWKLTPRTLLSFEAEHLQRQEVRGNSRITYSESVADPFRTGRTYLRYAGYADQLEEKLLGFNHQGPEEYNDRHISSFTATLDHRLGRDWALRVGLNYTDRYFSRINISGDNYQPAVREIRAGTGSSPRTPVWRPISEIEGTAQIDLTGKVVTGPITHRLLLTLDYLYTKDDRIERRMGSVFANNAAYNVRYLNVDNPNYFFVSYLEDSSIYSDLREDQYSKTDNIGVFVSDRLSFFKDRWIILAGARFDQVSYTVDNPIAVAPVPTYLEYDVDATTYQLGSTFKLTQNISLYGNASTSFKPQARLNIDGSPLPNEEGEGYEAGLKGTLFNGALNFTLAYFDITKRNTARETTQTTEDGGTQRVVILSGEEQAQGFEVDYNFQVTSSLTWFGAYGWVDSKITSNDEFPFLVGSSVRRVPEHNFGTGLRYEVLEGPAKGLYFTAGLTMMTEAVSNAGSGRRLTPSTGTPVLNLRLANGNLIYPDLPEGTAVTDSARAVRVGDGREVLKTDGFTKLDLGVGYRLRQRNPRRMTHKFQLNVKNVTDADYFIGSSQLADPRTYQFTYTLSL